MNTRSIETKQAESSCPYPAGLVALALAAGIIAGDWLQMPWRFTWLAVCGFAVVGIVVARHRPARTIPALILIAGAGAAGQARIHWQDPGGLDHLAGALERDVAVGVSLAGTITSFVTEDSSRIRFYFDPDRVHGFDGVRSVSGRARVTVGKKYVSPFKTGPGECFGVGRGMRLALRGELTRPSGQTNPGGFNYREFLRRKGTGSLLYVEHLDDCHVLDHAMDRIARIRRWFKSAISISVPRSSQAVPTALLTGDRSALDPTTRQEFAESGLMHLLAISGLHVLFVGLAAYGLLRSTLSRFRLRWRVVESTSSIATLMILFVYTLMTGAAPSVVRASTMAAVFLMSRPLFRTPNGLNSLGVAAVVVLALDPNSLFTAGFQLSFSAVFGLITAGVFMTRIVNRLVAHVILRWSLGLLAASAVATLSTASVMVYHFGYIPLAGLFLNLLAIPLASVLLVASIVTVAFAEFWPGVAAATGQSADLLSLVLQVLAGVGKRTTEWTLLRPPGSLPYLLLPWLLVLSLYPRLAPRVRFAWLLLAAAMPAIDLIDRAALRRFTPNLEVIFFDVGHGDAALVEFPGGRTMLVDAGNGSLRWDYGRRVILPHLNRERIDRLDAVVVSHPHADHFGGLPSILRRHDVGCVYDNGKHTESRLFGEYLDLVTNVTGCRRIATSGTTIDLDPAVRIETLAPPLGYDQPGENDDSVVLKIRFGDTSFLFTGDVEHDAERLLTESYCRRLRTDVVKVPHHGSRTSSTRDLVACVEAKWAVVSVGRHDKYGLPDEEIIRRWLDAGVDLLSTRSGSIQFRSDGRQITRIQ